MTMHPRSSPTTTTPRLVVIVGGGPAGAGLAHQLARLAPGSLALTLCDERPARGEPDGRTRATVIGLERAGGLFRVALDDGSVLAAHDVVLATGDGPPAPSPSWKPFLDHPRVVAAPMAPDGLNPVGPDETVLVVGTGPTAAEVVLALARRWHRGVVHAASRSGRWVVSDEQRGWLTILEGGGALRTYAGGARPAAAGPHGFVVTVDGARLQVDRVLMCSGPRQDARRWRSPLWDGLFDEGLAEATPAGIRTTDDGALPGVPGLWAVGGVRGARAPEVGAQIARLAAAIVSRTS